jgi:hypothetical protein
MKTRSIGIIVALLTLGAACSQAPSATMGTPPPTSRASRPAPALIGSWTTTVTKEDLLRVAPDFKPEFLCDNSGRFVWTFKGDGTFSIDQTVLPECPPAAQTHIESTWSNEGKMVTFAKGTPDQEVYQWTADGELLRLQYQSGNCIPCRATNTANLWQRLST